MSMANTNFNYVKYNHCKVLVERYQWRVIQAVFYKLMCVECFAIYSLAVTQAKNG